MRRRRGDDSQLGVIRTLAVQVTAAAEASTRRRDPLRPIRGLTRAERELSVAAAR
jgi:hypothetical protein